MSELGKGPRIAWIRGPRRFSGDKDGDRRINIADFGQFSVRFFTTLP